MSAFLLEIGVEEIPAGMIAAAQAELEESFRETIVRERLAAENFAVKSYSTPRRLALLMEGLLPKQPDREEEVVGPPLKAAYKSGAPTAAAIAFAKKNGMDVSALKTIQNAKGEYIAAIVQRPGQNAADVLKVAAALEIAGISWPKNMYWRAEKPERFVRPIRWLLALLDDEVVPVQFVGITADRVTYGHRVLHGLKPVSISHPQEYAEKLSAAFVEVSPEARLARIRDGLDRAAKQFPGARWREDHALLETVTNLTEWPSVLLGGFDASYLRLPEVVLETVMRDHQKYFALENADGRLLPNFLAVLNIELDAAGAAIVRHGNERVLRARFNDAGFFWDVDQKIPLQDRVGSLKNVTFQKDFGSYWDKTRAVVGIAAKLANTLQDRSSAISSEGKSYPDRESLLKAAELAKTDLTTELVKEFTELQGVVGGLYARAQGLGETVAQAIEDQYRPASIADRIPRSYEGLVLGLADRIQTIAAMFHLGFEPTGSKDPLALRRAGNAIAIIMMDSGISASLTVSELTQAGVEAAVPGDSGAGNVLAARIGDFLRERIAYYLIDGKQLPADCVKAAMAAGCEDVRDVYDRAQALADMRGSEDFLAVCAAFKRIRKILEQAQEKGETLDSTPASALFIEPEEENLYTWTMKTSVEGPDYDEALRKVAGLRPTVDMFFDRVMVMVPDEKLRQNRLALLQALYNDFTRLADFSQIAVESAPAS
jgi:glycyl-tRNA synthetase beta chain